MKRLTVEELKARPKPARCPGEFGDNYNCPTCGASYHCGACGGPSSMMGHYVKVDGYQGHWCLIAEGPS